MQARVIQAQAGVTGSEDGITNAQTKVLEAADKVTSIEKTPPITTNSASRTTYQAARNQAANLASERQSEILTQLNKRREEQTTVGDLQQEKMQRTGNYQALLLAGSTVLRQLGVQYRLVKSCSRFF